MKTKNLNARQPGLKEDWLADNAAFECPVCGKVYLVSGSINPVRTCPNCGQSHGHITGSRQGGGKAFVVWDHFALGQTYSRAKICRVLGGDEKECLPPEHGQVICGCFNPRRHPEAPDIITVGTGYIVQRNARLFCAQNSRFPSLSCVVSKNGNMSAIIGRSVPPQIQRKLPGIIKVQSLP